MLELHWNSIVINGNNNSLRHWPFWMHYTILGLQGQRRWINLILNGCVKRSEIRGVNKLEWNSLYIGSIMELTLELGINSILSNRYVCWIKKLELLFPERDTVVVVSSKELQSEIVHSNYQSNYNCEHIHMWVEIVRLYWKPGKAIM